MTLRLEGSREGLPASAVQTAYRVVRESLTNALRYASGAPVHVLVRGGAGAIDVEVVNDAARGRRGPGRARDRQRPARAARARRGVRRAPGGRRRARAAAGAWRRGSRAPWPSRWRTEADGPRHDRCVGGRGRAIAGLARRVRCREWPRSTPGSARWARAWSTTPSSSSARGRRRRSASPCACAAPSTSWPTRATACAARGCPRAPATTTGSCSTASASPTRRRAGSPTGLRGPSRVVDPRAFAWTDRRFRAAPLRDAVLYELHVGTFTAEGTFEAAAARLPALAELGVTHVELMPVGEFPGHHGWGYDGVYLSAAHSAYGGPHGLARFVDAAHAAGAGRHPRRRLQPRRRQRREGARGLRAVLHRAPRDAVGQGGQLRRRGLRRRPRVGAAERDRLGARLPRRRPAPRRDPRHPRRRRPPRAARAGRARARRRPPRAGHRRERPQRPQGHPARRARAATATTPRGPTTSTTPCARCSPASARAGTRSSGGSAQLAKAFHRPHVHDGGYSTFRGRRFGARADDRAPEQFVVFCQNHDQVGNRAFGDRLPATGAAAGRVLHAAGTLHAHAVHGRGARRARAVSVLLRSHRQAHGRRDPRGPPPGVRRVRRVRRRGGPRSAGPGHLRALQAHAPRQHEAARALRRAAARAPRAAARRRQHRVLRGRRLAARAPRRLRAGVQLRGGRADGAGRGAHGGRSPRTARPSATAACACPRARER